MSEAVLWYLSIFGWLFVTGIGIPPVPEEAGILYAASIHALHPEVRWPLAWLSCGLGILCADCVLYGVGWRWGPKLFSYRWVQRILSEERRLRIESRFHAHGMKLLILARFLPPLRTGVFLISGASRYPFAKFIAADCIYCIVGVGVFFFGGSALIELIKHVGYRMAWILAVPIAVYGLYRYYRYLKRKEIGPVPPVSVLQSLGGDAPPGEPAKRSEDAAAALREARIALKDT